MHENREKVPSIKRIVKTTSKALDKQKDESISSDLVSKLEGISEDIDSNVSPLTKLEVSEKHENHFDKTVPFTCKLCHSNTPNTMFSKKIQLKIHERKCHPKIRISGKEKSNKVRTQQLTTYCEFCSYECISKSALAKHILAVHRKERPHPCPECGKRFSQTSHVNYHLKTVHAEAGTVVRTKSHACHECGAKFGTSSTLRKHQRTHTGMSQNGIERIDLSIN